MAKKSNFNEAMFDMFGVGKNPDEEVRDVQETAAQTEKEVKEAQAAAVQTENVVKSVAPIEARKDASKNNTTPNYNADERKPDYPLTVIAEGSVFEGTLKTEGDVDISGKMVGDISSKGNIVLRCALEGNISAINLNIVNGDVKGDIHVDNETYIDVNSHVNGNIVSKKLFSSGKIEGDVDIAGALEFEKTASIVGNVTTGEISVAKGASINGRVEIK